MAWRRSGVAARVFAATALAGLAATQLLPVRYRAEAIILTSAQRIDEDFVRSAVGGGADEPLRLLNKELISRALLDSVVAEYGLYPEARTAIVPEDPVELLREDIELEPVKGDAFRVAWVSDSPTRARDVTNMLARLIIDERTQRRRQLADQVNDFLDAELAQTRELLTAQEARLDAYRRLHAGQMPTQVQANLLRLADAQAKAQAALDGIARDRERLDTLSRLQSRTADPVVAPPDPMALELDEARARLAELSARLTVQHPDVIAQTRRVTDLETAMAARPSGVPAATGASRPDAAEADAIAVRIGQREAEYSQLQATITDLRLRIDAAPMREAELAALNQDYETLQRLYAGLLTKANESRIAASLERTEMDQEYQLLEAARLPDQPHRPDERRLVAAVLAGALGLAGVVVGLLESRDTTLHDERDVELTTDVPLLAVVGEVSTPASRRRSWLGRLVTVGLLALVAAGVLVLG